MTSKSKIIELIPVYSIISVQSLLTDQPIFLDLFSYHPLWLIFLNKHSLSFIQTFNSLNKSVHHKSHILVFSNPDTVRKKLGINCDKWEIYWVDKRFKEDLISQLKIPQLPWVACYEEGVLLYSTHECPSSLINLNFTEENQIKNSKNKSKNLELFKEQIQLLKKKVKKFEQKEIEYKNIIADLKTTTKAHEAELQRLQVKIKDIEKKDNFQLEIETKAFLPNSQDLIQNYYFSKQTENESRRQKNLSTEVQGLNQIISSGDLWLNHLENSVNSCRGKKKLFPLKNKEKYSNRGTMDKHLTPEPSRFKPKNSCKNKNEPIKNIHY